MKEGVYFPPYFRECYISDRLKKFFEVNNLNSKSIVFDINILRKEFKRDYQNFTLIKEELELKGFNFVSNKNNSYFAKNIDYSSCEFIVNKVNDTLNPITLHKMGLWSLFSKLGLQDRNDLHYVPLERIEMLIYNSSNIRNLLIQYQFEIIKGWKNEEDITPLLSYDNSILFKVHETTDYYFEKGLSFGFPKICLKFLCKLATLPHTVKRILNESGIHTINDLLDITNTKKLEIINNVYESLDYSVDSGKFNRIFDDYFIELTSCKNSYFELKKNFEVLTRLSFSDTLFAKQKIINKVGVNIFNNIDFNNYRKQYVIFDFDYSFLFKRFNKIEGLKFNEQFSNCFHLFEINLHQVFVLNQLHFKSIDDFAVLNLNMNISRFGTISKDIRFKLIDIYSIFNLIDSVICEYSVEDPFQIDYIRNVFENITDQETYMIKLQLILKEMDINVLKRRDDEETLSEVAKVYGITREGIRQIEKRSIKRIHDICKNLLFDMFRYSDCYNIDDLKIYPGLLTYLRYNNSEYRMIKDNGILVSSKSFDYLDYQIKKFHELTHISVKSIRDLEDVSGVSVIHYFKRKSINFGFNNDLYVMVKKLGLREIGETFLKSCGKRGFSIKNDVQEARVFFERNYGINDISERNITVYITDNNSAVLYNNGEYIHKDFVDYKQIDIVTEILNRTNVDKYGIAARELFDNNFELLSSVNINNYYFLYGIIKKYNIGKFYCSGRSMRIYNEESNIDDVLISYIEDNGGIVKIEKLKEDLSIVNSTIQQKTMTILSKFDRDTITLRARFNISEFEKNELKKIIDAIIAKKRYCHSLDIIEIIYYDDNRNRFLKDNKINNNPTRLMYFLAVIFGNDYKYVHSINILTLHNLEINSIEDLVKIEFSNNIFTRKKVYDFLEKYGYSSSNVYNLHKQNVLPLGNARFIFKKELVYDEKLLFAINEVANRYFSNQLFILANELIRKLKLENIGAIYYNEPVKLVSVLSKYTHSNWIRPINDLPIDKSITDELLVNNSKFCNNDVTFKQLIKSFVYFKFKNYVTIDDINELLYNYELLKYKIPNEILESIFENELDSGLVKVVK